MLHGMDRMKYFGIETPPAFANNLLLSWDDLNFTELEPYVEEMQRHGCASVNVFDVVGTKHPDYRGGSWLNLLMKGRRMEINLPLFESAPDYYVKPGPKIPYMEYLSIDGGKLYIGSEGNHRTCIARFYFSTIGHSMLHGVNLIDYKIDWNFKRTCDELKSTAQRKRLPISVAVKKVHFERQDAADWCLDKYNLTAKVTDARSGETCTMSHAELVQYVEKLKKAWWKFW